MSTNNDDNAPNFDVGGDYNSPKSSDPLGSRSVGTKNNSVENSLFNSFGRVPPHSINAEQAVLAAVLIRPQVMNSLVDILQEQDFYTPGHQILYKVYLELYKKSIPADIISVAEFLDAHKELDKIGGAVYLSELSQAVVSAANAEHYANIVREKSLQRTLIQSCSDIINRSFDPTIEVPDLLDEAEQAIFSIAQRTATNDFSPTSVLIDQVFSKLEKLASSKELITGITTGYSSIDQLTSGLQNSDLIIVAARPSMGKTAFALCIAINAAITQGSSTAIFSLEMSKDQLTQRMLAARGRVDLSRLRRPATLTDEDWANLYQAADSLGRAPIYIDDTASLKTLELRSRARRLKAEKGLDLIIVDYLQLMRSSRKTDSRELEISDISRSLKALAKELCIPVIALSQLNRKSEERSDKRPMLSDLRESGAIEQDADVIMFVYREDVYKYTKASERPLQGKAEIIIGKQRNGPVGVAELMYLSPFTTFENISNEYIARPSENT